MAMSSKGTAVSLFGVDEIAVQLTKSCCNVCHMPSSHTYSEPRVVQLV